MELFILLEFIFPLGNPVFAEAYGTNKVDTWLLWVIAAAVYIVICAFKGVGLYTMAKKKDKKKLFCLLGFVPFASTYAMGKLGGELRLGKTKVKYLGLLAMAAEIILCVGYAVQDIPQSVIFMNESLYEVRPTTSGTMSYLTLWFSESVPAGLVTAMNFFSIFCSIFYFIWLVLYVFLCMAFFRVYAPASYIWLVILCAFLPVVTAFLIFAFRNRDPVDFDKYMQQRMENIRRAQQAQYGPYGQNPYGPYGQNPYGQNPYGQGPYGQNPYGQGPYGGNPYGQNPYGQNAYGGPAPKEPDDPFGEYAGPSSNGPQGSGQGDTQNDPFGEYVGGKSGNSDENKENR